MPIANMLVETSIAQFRSAVAAEMTGWLNAAKPGDFQAVELRVHKLARGLADAIAAFVLRERCADRAFSTECVKAASYRSVSQQRFA